MKTPSRNVVIFVTSGDKFYISRRLDASRAFHNFWQCPGGKLERNEETIEGALRELEEEMGLRLSPDRLSFLNKKLRKFPTGEKYVALNYHLELSEFELPQRTEPHKSSDWKLVSLKQLDTFHYKLIPGLRELMQGIVAQVTA